MQAFSAVDSFRFAGEDKSSAYVKFMAHEPSGDALVNTIRQAIRAQNPGAVPFEVALLSSDKQD